MIATFVRRPVFTTMLVMLLVVFGLKSYPSLGIDLYPDVDFPVVTVNVNYTGASPEEMESLITKPIEDAVSSLAGIKTLSSISREGSSVTVVEFELGTNSKQATQDVREKVAGVKRRLPEQADDAVVQRFDMSAQAVLTFSLASDTRNREEIYKLAQDTVKDELQKIDGVAEVGVYGGSAREIQILTDPRKLEAYNISLQQIMTVVDSQNVNTPGGHITSKENEQTVRIIGKYKSIDQIKSIVVANQQGRLIRLTDVATVTDSYAEERSYSRTNGIPSVSISVQKQSGTNTVAVAEQVKKTLEKMQQQKIVPSDINVSWLIVK